MIEPSELSLVMRFLLSRKNGTTRASYFGDLCQYFEFLKFIRRKSYLVAKRLDVDAFQEYLRRHGPVGRGAPNSNRTVLRKVSCVSSFYTFLCREDVLLSNPCQFVERLRVSREVKTEALGTQDFKTLLNSLDRERVYDRMYYAVFLLLGTTGMRIGELTSLRIDSYSFRKGESVLQFKVQKSNKLVVKVLPKSVQNSIDEHLMDRMSTNPQDPLFASCRTIASEAPRDLSRMSVFKKLKRKISDLKIDGHEALNIHSFRAGFITKALDKYSLSEVAKEVGHTSISQTHEYDKRRTNNSLGAANFIMEDEQ